ncbi:ABC transporter permease [Jannaschia sp. R86511]|uniref:ABC transporter permease n=1 Tax=Jannaschia sp. R86511 TaxID=3093853 RepID=UPI0036D2B5B3
MTRTPVHLPPRPTVGVAPPAPRSAVRDIVTITSQQVVSLRRQRTFSVLLGTLVAVTALAGVIGWSSQNTIARVYDQAVLLLASTGQPAPVNPVSLKPPLALLSNMAIYVPLIGALLAVVVGHLTLADDEASGMGRLLFSRGVRRQHYIAGRLVGTALVLAAALAASLLVSGLALVVVHGGAPSGDEVLRLLSFYLLSWCYLMVFALVGMVAVLLTRSRSLALLSALAAWLVVTFAVPQLVSGLRPVESLNPLSAPATGTSAFFHATGLLRPLSLSEQYKGVAAHILQTTPDGAVLTPVVAGTVPVLLAVVALAALTVVLVTRHDYSRSVSND